MPSKTKLKNAAIAAKSAALPKIPKELIDQFITGPITGEAVNAASLAFKKALVERAMDAELGYHLGYPAGAAKPDAATNQRNGKSAKTVLTSEGSVRIEVPRDRDGSFEPILIPTHERRFTGFDEHIIAMYARGMTMPEALGAVFPVTTLQTCIVHLIRNSLDYASWKERKTLASAIRPSHLVAYQK